jgi:diacylglycerol kinase family enzyme
MIHTRLAGTRSWDHGPVAAGGFLIVNPRSGAGSPSADELCSEARSHGLSVHALEEGDDVEAVARSADASAIGIAGGDGSLGLVAGVAVERGVPFVCIPFGTRNHFARDLGLDRADPIAALAAFDSGIERRVDLARADGRAFLNNASLGLYADLVRRREHHRRRGVALARLRALARSLHDRRPRRLTLDGEPADVRVLLVGNNAYTLDAFELGTRDRLDEGLLHVYLVGGLLPSGWTELEPRSELLVESVTRRLSLALDGEPVELESPLRITVEPGALRVLVPGPGV